MVKLTNQISDCQIYLITLFMLDDILYLKVNNIILQKPFITFGKLIFYIQEIN